MRVAKSDWNPQPHTCRKRDCLTCPFHYPAFIHICLLGCVHPWRLWLAKQETLTRFNLHGSVKLFGKDRERNIQNENICLQQDSNPHHATPRLAYQHLVSLGQGALIIICGLMFYRILGYKLMNTLCDNMCQIDYGYMCIWTDCQTLSTFLIPMYILASIITVYRTWHWLSNHKRFHVCICINQWGYR